MVKPREEVLKLAREFHESLAGLYGDRLVGVYLYGSYARGDATEDSDIDIAVVLEGPVNARRETRRTSEVFSDLCLRENCLLIPFFLSEEEHRDTPYAIHRKIVREGVPA